MISITKIRQNAFLFLNTTHLTGLPSFSPLAFQLQYLFLLHHRLSRHFMAQCPIIYKIPPFLTCHPNTSAFWFNLAVHLPPPHLSVKHFFPRCSFMPLYHSYLNIHTPEHTPIYSILIIFIPHACFIISTVLFLTSSHNLHAIGLIKHRNTKTKILLTCQLR